MVMELVVEVRPTRWTAEVLLTEEVKAKLGEQVIFLAPTCRNSSKTVSERVHGRQPVLRRKLNDALELTKRESVGHHAQGVRTLFPDSLEGGRQILRCQ